MIRIFEENSILGVSSVMIKDSFVKGKNRNKENNSTEKKEAKEAKNVNMSEVEMSTELDNDKVSSVETDESILEACMEDTGLSMEEDSDSGVEHDEEREADLDSTIYNEYVGSLNEQIEFLKGQIDEKNKQLNSKDELILNFQFLLKEDRSRILLLEDKLEDKKVGFWKRLFKKNM